MGPCRPLIAIRLNNSLLFPRNSFRVIFVHTLLTRSRFWSFFVMRDSVRQKTSRDAILDATDRLLSVNGYKKMTIDDLAREVGIGKGSVYLHFKSKEEIALSHIDRIIERLKARLRAIAQNKSTCEKRLRQMLIERVFVPVRQCSALYPKPERNAGSASAAASRAAKKVF